MSQRLVVRGEGSIAQTLAALPRAFLTNDQPFFDGPEPVLGLPRLIAAGFFSERPPFGKGLARLSPRAFTVADGNRFTRQVASQLADCDGQGRSEPLCMGRGRPPLSRPCRWNAEPWCCQPHRRVTRDAPQGPLPATGHQIAERPVSPLERLRSHGLKGSVGAEGLVNLPLGQFDLPLKFPIRGERSPLPLPFLCRREPGRRQQPFGIRQGPDPGMIPT